MNEALFFAEIALLLLSARAALAMGKEALIGFTALQAILANLFVVKQITLFGLSATCGDVFAVSSLLGLNWIQRAFGSESAQKAIYLSFGFMLLFVAASAIHLSLEPSSYDQSHSSFHAILSPAPRILISSIATFFVVQKLDLLLFSRLCTVLPPRFATLPSLLLSQAFDTLLFTPLALWGIAANLWEVMFVAFTIKAITVSFIFFSSLFMKRAENKLFQEKSK